MKELNRKFPDRKLAIRLWVLKDKKSFFRASEPDQHIFELMSVVEGKPTVIMRQGRFATREEARALYDRFVNALK